MLGKIWVLKSQKYPKRTKALKKRRGWARRYVVDSKQSKALFYSLLFSSSFFSTLLFLKPPQIRSLSLLYLPIQLSSSSSLLLSHSFVFLKVYSQAF